MKYMKFLIMFLCISNLVGCAGESAIKNDNAQTQTEIKKMYVSQPNYIGRLQSKKIEHGERLNDGAELIHEVIIKYSPTNALELSVFLNNSDKNNGLYIKSNMSDEKIVFFEDMMNQFDSKDFIINNLHFDLHTYRIIRITIGKAICWLPLDDLIDEKVYPKGISSIYENHPKVPNYKYGTIGNVIIDDGNGKFIQLSENDAQEIINIYSEITDDMFWDYEKDKGAPNYMESQTIYLVFGDDVYQYKPLLNTGTMIDYGIYIYENQKVYQILEKYITLNQP